VRAQRYFEVIDEEDLVDNAARVGAYFSGELQRFAAEFPQLVSNVRGRGLMAAFDLPSGEIRDAALKAFMANDVMVLASGHHSARFRPPLNLSIEEAAEGIRRMEKALEQLARPSAKRARCSRTNSGLIASSSARWRRTPSSSSRAPSATAFRPFATRSATSSLASGSGFAGGRATSPPRCRGGRPSMTSRHSSRPWKASA